MCYCGSPGIIDSRELLAVAHAEKRTHTVSEIAAHASPSTNKHAKKKKKRRRSRVCGRSVNRKLPPQGSACVASDDMQAVLAAMYAEHTHTLPHTHTRSFLQRPGGL